MMPALAAVAAPQTPAEQEAAAVAANDAGWLVLAGAAELDAELRSAATAARCCGGIAHEPARRRVVLRMDLGGGRAVGVGSARYQPTAASFRAALADTIAVRDALDVYYLTRLLTTPMTGWYHPDQLDYMRRPLFCGSLGNAASAFAPDVGMLRALPRTLPMPLRCWVAATQPGGPLGMGGDVMSSYVANPAQIYGTLDAATRASMPLTAFVIGGKRLARHAAATSTLLYMCTRAWLAAYLPKDVTAAAARGDMTVAHSDGFLDALAQRA